jgi:DNA-damage-inducible protein J
MAKTASLNIRIDPETKAGAEKLFSTFGITVTDAVNIFLRQSLMEGGLPFEMKLPKLRADAENIMREERDNLLDQNQG